MLHGWKDAGQTHCSIYPSIFNRLRAIARYWSEIATFSYPHAFNDPVGGVSIGIPGKSLVLRKLKSWGWLPGSEDSLTIGWGAVATQYQRVTDRQTDVQPISRTCTVWLTHVKNGVHVPVYRQPCDFKLLQKLSIVLKPFELESLQAHHLTAIFKSFFL